MTEHEAPSGRANHAPVAARKDLIASRSLREILGEADHDRRMAAARRRAEWELGDASWAGCIVSAYLFPEEDAAALAAEVNA